MDFIILVIVVAVIWFLYRVRKSQSKIIYPKQDMHQIIAYQVRGDGNFAFDIVGEASYQNNLKQIAGDKDEVRKAHECIAIIRAEPNNPHDPNAVAVGIDNKIVGYFDRATAKKFHKFLEEKNLNKHVIFAVEAMVVGGWADQYSTGDYGVKLDVPQSLGKWELDRIEN